MSYIKNLILMLIIANTVLAGSLVYSDFNPSSVCLFGGSCESVQDSAYGSLFGIKLSQFGLFSFLLLFFVALITRIRKRYEPLLMFLALCGAAFASWFIYIQAFILKQFCSTCIALDSIMILIFFLLVYDYFKSKRR